MNIGDAYLIKVGPKGHEKILKGVVIALHPKFFLVDFGVYKECFSNVVDEGL